MRFPPTCQPVRKWCVLAFPMVRLPIRFTRGCLGPLLDSRRVGAGSVEKRFSGLSLPRALPFLFALFSASGTDLGDSRPTPADVVSTEWANEPLQKIGDIAS